MPMNTPSFAQTIRARRNKLGLTQEEVSAKGGPSDTTQRRVEGGEIFNITQSTLKKYEAGLDWRPGVVAELLSRDTEVDIDKAELEAAEESGDISGYRRRRAERTQKPRPFQFATSEGPQIQISALEMVSLYVSIKRIGEYADAFGGGQLPKGLLDLIDVAAEQAQQLAFPGTRLSQAEAGHPDLFTEVMKSQGFGQLATNRSANDDERKGNARDD
ncbi:helix-turn-helix domain-containing protein [Rhodococcoides fascians]|uniref:helix-turn-helix domain-containing protein n=1 Tax=Rhodococcoides fascians TaxID=1828 RepID=UPI000562021A|nr:helix-turn-helix domain-containing protein [Rhodococcus fascians]